MHHTLTQTKSIQAHHPGGEGEEDDEADTDDESADEMVMPQHNADGMFTPNRPNPDNGRAGPYTGTADRAPHTIEAAEPLDSDDDITGTAAPHDPPTFVQTFWSFLEAELYRGYNARGFLNMILQQPLQLCCLKFTTLLGLKPSIGKRMLQ
jgi:hypothetical protein